MGGGKLFSAISIAILGAALAVMSPVPASALPEDCACPKVDCGPCAEQKGVNFYTEKCGGGLQVKSCARPQCVPMDPLPSTCSTAVAPPEADKRVPASVPRLETLVKPAKASLPQGAAIGAVKALRGNAWVVDAQGAKNRAVEGLRVREGEKLMTEVDSGLKVSFDNGNEVHLSPSSELDLTKVDAAKGEGAGGKKTLLQLLKGRVRNKVKEKYQGTDTSFYRVETKGAVAGVRGTDFVVSYDTKDRVVMKVETLEGAVQLSDRSGEQQVEIPAGRQASHVIAANSNVFNDDEISDFIARGYMTPVYEMSAAEIKSLQTSTELPERAIASVDSKDANSQICSTPRGRLNQCSWTCENNPAKADRCRTDLPQVNCVRRRCNANGEWSEDSRLPASFYDACQPSGSRVGTCDY